MKCGVWTTKTSLVTQSTPYLLPNPYPHLLPLLGGFEAPRALLVHLGARGHAWYGVWGMGRGALNDALTGIPMSANVSIDDLPI